MLTAFTAYQEEGIVESYVGQDVSRRTGVVELGGHAARRGMPEVVFYDEANNPITRQQFETWFGGALDIRTCDPLPGLKTLRLAAVCARDWGAVQLVTLLDDTGAPLINAAVGRWWPDAPQLDPFPPDCMATRWKDRAVVGWTDLNGNVGFGMGKGDCPPGSSACWPIHCKAPADFCGGLGWSPGREHKTAALVFVLVDDEEPPPPPDDNWRLLFERLDEIIARMPG